MGKIYVLRGLPASGKSTKAKELFEEGKNFRVNRDLLREMMHFGKYSTLTEREIMNVEKMIVQYALMYDFDVIIDDTNLKDKTIQMWRDVIGYNPHKNHEIEIINMDTSIEECISRDSKRDKPVGEETIRKMADWDKTVDSH